MNDSILLVVLGWASAIFVFFLGSLVLLLVVVFIYDISQTRHAVLHNYPVIGHFRYFFERLGEFFRQYFFALDWEEMPFNRAQRSWVYRAAKNLDNTVAFGSTRNLHAEGTILFVNCAFPTLGEDAVEPKEITIGDTCLHPYVTRSFFHISGMSFGAISKPAIEALSKGAKMAGCWLNTGEGGLAPEHLESGADIVFQIGTAKNGVRDLQGNLNEDKLREIAALPQVKMFELKLSQGAKPGKGGILPAAKVTEEIAKLRGVPMGEDAISPNRHKDIRTNLELLKMIHHLREVTDKPVGFKMVLGSDQWLDGIFQEIRDIGLDYAPDFITLDGAEGGSGAAPMSLMDEVGMSIREALPLLVNKRMEYGLENRIRIIASGKLITPAEVAWALCMGADFICTARGFMFALGCIQAMQCNRNTCPTGITTHNKRLQAGLDPAEKSVRVMQYHHNILHEVGVIAHSCGVRRANDLARHHARMVLQHGLSKGLDELFPLPQSIK